MGNLFAGGTAAAQPHSVPPEASKPGAQAVFTIEVINGSKQSEEKFRTPEGKQ